jgi:hypothetical protein
MHVKTVLQIRRRIIFSCWSRSRSRNKIVIFLFFARYKPRERSRNRKLIILSSVSRNRVTIMLLQYTVLKISKISPLPSRIRISTEGEECLPHHEIRPSHPRKNENLNKNNNSKNLYYFTVCTFMF